MQKKLDMDIGRYEFELEILISPYLKCVSLSIKLLTKHYYFNLLIIDNILI